MVRDELRNFHDEYWRNKLDCLEIGDNSPFRMAKALVRRKISIFPLHQRNKIMYSMEDKLETFDDFIEAQFQANEIFDTASDWEEEVQHFREQVIQEPI